MTPQERLRISIASARYLEAFERGDEDTLDKLWEQAANDDELLASFREIHTGLIQERDALEERTIASAVETHLTSGEIIRPSTGPVTVGDVANELFRHAPDRLPAAAHALNETLRTSSEPLPIDLGLANLTAWAEAKFGGGDAAYWKAFRQAAIKVRMRAAADTEFQLAARKTPRKPEGT